MFVEFVLVMALVMVPLLLGTMARERPNRRRTNEGTDAVSTTGPLSRSAPVARSSACR